MEIFLVLLVGCFSGMVTGLTGASGVMVVVPLITILFRFPIHQAIGTSLVVDVLTSLMISVTYFKNDNIALKSAGWVALSSVAMAQIGARFSGKIEPQLLSSSFVFVLIVLSIIMWRTGIKRHKEPVTPIDLSNESTVWRLALSVLLAGGSGFLTGFIGAGGGTNILLILLFVNRFPMHKALGTSILIMSLTALSGVIGHATFGLGYVNLRVGATLALSSILTGIYCARYTSKISEKSLSRLMSGVYLILGVVMMIINYRNS